MKPNLRLVKPDEAEPKLLVKPAHWRAADAAMGAAPELWLGLTFNELAEKREQIARMLAEVLP